MNAVVAEIPATNPAPHPLQDTSSFAQAQRAAKAMAASTLVPDTYRNNIPNVLIAMEVANRIGASPFLVMQNLYIVHGRPSWSSQFLIATVNACGRFSPLRFEVQGDDPTKKDYRVRAYATDKESGERCDGPWITWGIVDAEGWEKKTGSKWKSIPDLMFRYRAAGFWTRLFAPELSMGILTREEVEDVWGHAQVQPNAPTQHGNIKALEAELTGQPVPPADPDTPAMPPETDPSDALPVKEIRRRLQLAETVDEVRACDALIEAVPDDAERDDLRVLQDARLLAVQ